MPDARQTTQGKEHTPGHWTRCTGLHSIPDRPRRDDRNGGKRWGLAVCPKLSKSGQPETKKINTQKSVNTY